jgi:hypothetical protein
MSADDRAKYGSRSVTRTESAKTNPARIGRIASPKAVVAKKKALSDVYLAGA